MCIRTGSIRFHKKIATKSARIVHPNTLTVLNSQFFAENLILSEVKDLGTKIHTIHYYIAEVYPVLIHWGECMLLFYFAGV